MNILNSINHNSFIVRPPRVFTSFMFNIAGGTNYTGSANQYPITFNSSTTSNTYGVITNFTGATVKGKSFTIYVKGKCINPYTSLRTPVLLCFVNTNFTSSTYFTLGRANGSTNYKKITSSIYHNNTLQIYLLTPDILTNIDDVFHTFMVFDSISRIVSIYNYSNIGTLINSSIQAPPLYDTILDPLNIFTFAKCRGDSTTSSNITIHIAGWYNYVVSSNEMSSIVNISPN